MDVDIIKVKTEDDVYLNGFLKYNNEKSKKVIVTVHGMAGNCFNKRAKEIAENAVKNNIDVFSFNNRGSDVLKYLEKSRSKFNNEVIGGSAYENFYESYYDIKAVISHLVEIGYEDVYICGHSLGATKVLYSYQRFVENNDNFLNNIKAVILLSLVDLNNLFKICSGNKFNEYVEYAKKEDVKNKVFSMMPRESFIYPISVKSYLIYSTNNEKIDIVRYSQPDYDYKELNAIKKPLFMRWGNVNELIEQTPEEVVNIVKNKVKNEALNIGIIDGADHMYRRKEKQLASEIIEFLSNQ